MSRRVRFFSKKRGSRRTGSQQAGSLGWMLFLATMFVGGWLLLVFIVRLQIVPEWRANRHFRAAQCVVLKKRIGEQTVEAVQLYRPEVQIRYEVEGQTYTRWTYNMAQLQGAGYSSGQEDKQTILDQFEINQTYPCWYDPADHSQAVVYRSRAWVAWALLILPGSFIILGGTGLGYAWINWGTSTERRAALARRAERAVQLDRFDPTIMAASEFPFVPPEGDLNNSPGVRLAYRLPVSDSAVGAIASLIVGTVLWNLVGLAFLWVAVQGLVQRQPDWTLTVLVLPFLAAGAWLIRYTVRRTAGYMGLGPTLLEISTHPLHPGGACQVNLSQSGWLDLRFLEVVLVCEERATFQQGTNSRTDTRLVHEQVLLKLDKPSIRPETPLERDFEFVVPEHAMHSFRSRHNEVSWRLILRGESPGKPGLQREFPLVVRPPANRSQAA